MNGRLLDEEEAGVSVFDHGFVTGDGVFESVLVHEHRPFALRRHLERLERSARQIRLKPPPPAELEGAVNLVVEEAALREAKVRITVTGGIGPLASMRSAGAPTVVVAIAPLEGRPPQPADVLVLPWPRNDRSILSGAKTTSYAENVAALAWAVERGADEAVFLNLAGDLCEGTGTNVFVGIEGRLLTPPLSSGCLAGVTRALVLEIADAVEEPVPAERLGEVTEAFLTSTTRGAQPIRTVDGRALPECPGKLTSSVQERFAELLEEGTD